MPLHQLQNPCSSSNKLLNPVSAVILLLLHRFLLTLLRTLLFSSALDGYGAHDSLSHAAHATTGAAGDRFGAATSLPRQLGLLTHSVAGADHGFLPEGGEDACLGCCGIGIGVWGLRDAQVQGAQNTRRGRHVLPSGAAEAASHGTPASASAAHEFLQYPGFREFHLPAQSPREQLKHH